MFADDKRGLIALVPLRLCVLLLATLLFVLKLSAYAQTPLVAPTEETSTTPLTAQNAQSEPFGVAVVQPTAEPMFTINFRDADLLEVLEVYSNLLGVNILPGEGVSGIVTVISPGPVTRSQAVNLLHSILKHRGFTVIENDGYLSVVEDAIAEMSGFPMYSPSMPDDQVAVAAIRLRYIGEEALAMTLDAMGLMRPVSTLCSPLSVTT